MKGIIYICAVKNSYKAMNSLTKHALLCGSAALLLLASCGEDRSGEYAALTQEDRWIEQQMRNLYLWYEDMPEVEEADYFTEPEDFFKSLLSKRCRNGEGDQFSYFEKTDEESDEAGNNLRIDETSSYGFDFLIYNDPTGTTAHKMARVLFVIPDSPAEEAGLRRGDWILNVGGANITESNYKALIQGGATTLGIADLTVTAGEEGNTASWSKEAVLELGASRAVSNSPFYKTDVFVRSGRRVGYLMYDHFEAGATENGTEYNEEMKQIFADFKSRGVNEFILDLRYNPGGTVSCITELCSFLAPSEYLGQPFLTLEYNDKNSDRNSTANLNRDLAAQNLNLSTLYVITGSYTASASESTINCLRPYMDVKIIGATTVGKNVASVGLVSTYGFTLHPIVATVYNSRYQSDFERGIEPDYLYNEIEYASRFGEIGNPESDALLGYALQWIANGSLNLPTSEVNAAALRSRDGKKLAPCFCTVSHKRVQGNLISQ